jgi:phosphate transport system substrate-binding protein
MLSQHRRELSVFVIVVWLLPLIAACSQPPATQSNGELQGTLTISGAFALYPMMVQWGDEFHQLNPGIQFDISAGGAGKGMADTLAGAVDIGMVSRDVKPEETAQGAFTIAVTKDAVFPIVSAQNPVLQDLLKQGIPQATFVKIYITGEIKTWGQVVGRPEIKDAIHVYTRSDASGAADTWASYLGKKQEDLLGIGVYGDPGIMDATAKDPLGLGYNNLSYAFDAETGQAVAGAALVPIDANANGQADPDEVLDTKVKAIEAVANGKYPSPPARVLNLVTKGQPTGITQAFIRWILTDGQKYIDSAGYIALPQDQLSAGLDKLK